jgi:hypothetical protein
MDILIAAAVNTHDARRNDAKICQPFLCCAAFIAAQDQQPKLLNMELNAIGMRLLQPTPDFSRQLVHRRLVPLKGATDAALRF